MAKVIKFIQDQKVILLGIVLLVLLAAGLYIKVSKKPFSPSAVSQIESPKLVKTEVSREEIVVEVSSAGFTPQTIRMKKGGAVRFISIDNNPHQVMSDPHPAHNLYPFLNTDEVLNTRESATVILEGSGTFTYHDHLNPLKFKGIVIVE